MKYLVLFVLVIFLLTACNASSNLNNYNNKNESSVSTLINETNKFIKSDSFVNTIESNNNITSIVGTSTYAQTSEIIENIKNVSETTMTSQQTIEINNSKSNKDAPILKVTNVDSETNLLSWTTVDNAVSYILYILNYDTGEFEKYGEIKGNACNDKKLESDKKYTYRVAARFSDETLGELSEPVSIYTYSKAGGAVQGNYIYFTIDNDDGTSSLMRFDRINEKSQKIITSSSDYYFGFVLASEKHLFYSLHFENDYAIACSDFNGKNEKILCRFDDDHILEKKAVINDILFYSYRSSSVETDEYCYKLCALDVEGNPVKELNNIYDGFYNGISFVYNENDVLYCVWQCEEIDRETAENSESNEIITKSASNICLFNTETTERLYIPCTDFENNRIMEICGYVNGIVYVQIYDGRFGFISEEGKFVEIELPTNSNNVSVNPKNGDVFYEHTEYIDTDTAKKEIIYLSNGKTYKIADLYCDSNINLQRYKFYGHYIIYTSQSKENTFYDLSTGYSIILK